MKRLLLAVLLVFPFAAMADCLATWNPNPPEQNITAYIVEVGANTITLPGTDTDVLCSEFTPPIDPTIGPYTMRVYAENEWGRSASSAPVPFGSPEPPVGVSVSRQ